MRVGGGYELLSSYLNRVFTEQDNVALQYHRQNAKRMPISPYVPRQFPMQVTPTKPSRVFY